MTDRDRRLIALIDSATPAGMTDEDREYLVRSLAYGNVEMSRPVKTNQKESK